MTTKRVIQSLVLASLVLVSSLAHAQYEEEPYIEVFVAGNVTLPNGYIKNDLEPVDLNAKTGFGFDAGIGYYLKSQLVLGLYFDNRNMAVESDALNHRVFEFGAYGKFLLFDLTEQSLSPYLKLSAGINFSKLGTQVTDNGQPKLRELSYDPTLGLEGALGLHVKTNSYGGIFLEAAYHLDMMNDVKGDFESIEYPWDDNNNYLMLRAGVLFNIGPKE